MLAFGAGVRLLRLPRCPSRQAAAGPQNGAGKACLVEGASSTSSNDFSFVGSSRQLLVIGSCPLGLLSLVVAMCGRAAQLQAG
eukprot:9327960-Prorocentrum_lima.AAC.1